MICEVGKCWYPLPEKWFQIYDSPRLEVDTRDRPGYSFLLMQLAPDEMATMRAQAEGGEEFWAQPRYFAIIGDKFWMHPPPDKAYVVLTRYHQHPKVW